MCLIDLMNLIPTKTGASFVVIHDVGMSLDVSRRMRHLRKEPYTLTRTASISQSAVVPNLTQFHTFSLTTCGLESTKNALFP